MKGLLNNYSGVHTRLARSWSMNWFETLKRNHDQSNNDSLKDIEENRVAARLCIVQNLTTGILISSSLVYLAPT